MKNNMIKALAAAAVASTLIATAPAVSAADQTSAKTIAEGKKLAFSRSKGNCLACHWIKDGTLPGNIGPGLIQMSKRYSKQKLRDKIWGKPELEVKYSMMPPFGRHAILSEDEIDKIVEYIYTL